MNTTTQTERADAGQNSAITSGDAWKAYHGTRSGTFHRNGRWIGQAAQAAMESEAYAAWEAAVIREMTAQGGVRAPNQEWGGHTNPEAFAAR